MGVRIDLPTEEICRRYQRGENSIDLAAEFGTSVPTILARLRESGVHIRMPGRCGLAGLPTTSLAPGYSSTLLDPDFDEWTA